MLTDDCFVVLLVFLPAEIKRLRKNVSRGKKHMRRLCDPLLTLALLYTQAAVNLATGQARVVTAARGRSQPTSTELTTAANAAGFPARGGWGTIGKGTSVVLDVKGLKVCCGLLSSTTECRHTYQCSGGTFHGADVTDGCVILVSDCTHKRDRSLTEIQQ